MNKRVNIFYLVTVIVAVLCLILDLIFQDNSFSFLGICFSLTITVYGVALIIRGFGFKIDSSLFLGIIILTFGVVALMTTFTKFGYRDLWHYLLLGASLSGLVTGLYFKVPVQKKLAILFLGLFVSAFLFQIKIYSIWIMFLIMFIWFVMFIFVNNILSSRRKINEQR